MFWWLSPVVGMFKIVGPTALRSIASNFVAKSEQSKLFAFISGTDVLLQLATSGKLMVILSTTYILLDLLIFCVL